ncbi:MAG: hypothetical protein ACYCUD_00755 [Candidatus Dormibacteria bacterium]
MSKPTDRNWRWAAGMPASFLAISFLVTLPLWLGHEPRLLGYSEDTAMHLWFLRWFPFALAHGLNPFVTDATTYPHSVNLLWNNANLVLAFLSWPLLTLVGGAVGINLIYVLLLACAGAGTAGVLRSRVSHASSAWVGGLLVGFSPFTLSELSVGHLTWVTTATLPLGWWVGERTLRAVRHQQHRVRWGMAAGSWMVLQFWFSKELLATTLLMAVLLGAVYCLRGGWRDLGWLVRQGLVAAGAAAIVTVALMAYPLVDLITGSAALNRPSLTAPGQYVADLLSFIVPGSAQLLLPGVASAISNHFTGLFVETDGYLGLPLVALAVWVATRLRRDPLVAFGSWCAGLAALLSLGPWLHIGGHRLSIPLPWLVLLHLPVYAKAVPSRVLIFVVIGVACLLAAGWDRLVPKLRPAARAMAFAILFVPLLPSLGIVQGIAGFPVTLPSILASRQLLSLPQGSVIMTLPIGTRVNHGLAMFWQAESNFRFVQPFGFLLHPGPGGITTPFNYPSPLERLFHGLTVGGSVPGQTSPRALRAQFRAWRVAAVVVMPGREFSRDVQVLNAVLVRKPEVIDGAAVWLQPGSPALPG